MARNANILTFEEARQNHASTRTQTRSTHSSSRSPRTRFADDAPQTQRSSRNVGSAGRFDLNLNNFPADPAWLSQTSAQRTVAKSGSSRASSSRREGSARSERTRFNESVQPRAAITSFEDNDEGEKSRKQTRAERKRAKQKEKAEKKFNRQFAESSSASEGGPRAAVYKGEMGSKHRQAIRKQNDAAGKASSGLGFSFAGLLTAGAGLIAKAFSSPKRIVLSSVVVCLIFGCAFLYGPTKQYYQTAREHARLNIERELVLERANELSAEEMYLKTDEGIKQKAHSEYGWIEPGENAVTVYGIEAENTSSSSMINIKSGEIEPPATWYSPILDFVFDVQ